MTNKLKITQGLWSPGKPISTTVHSRSKRRRREILTKTRRGGVSLGHLRECRFVQPAEESVWRTFRVEKVWTRLAQLSPVGIWPADVSPDHTSRYNP